MTLLRITRNAILPRVVLGILLGGVLLVSGCSIPEVKLGEKEVPAPNMVTQETRYAWAQAADWIEKDYQTGHPDPEVGQDVASTLSISLGPPLYLEDNPKKIIKTLNQNREDEADAREKTRDFLQKHQGKTIEGTGIDLLGWVDGYWVVVLVIAIIILMGGGPILVMVVNRVRVTLIQTVRAIERMKQEDPAAAAVYERIASEVMDDSHKRQIQAEQRRAFKVERKAQIAKIKRQPKELAPKVPTS
jgi:uncharacterized membrane protein